MESPHAVFIHAPLGSRLTLPIDEDPQQWIHPKDPKRPWQGCACSMSNADIETHMQEVYRAEEAAAIESKETALNKLHITQT
jgi:hypothetical protein